jgi:DNA-directed RNA polymerase subunit RPC12/RpoP
MERDIKQDLKKLAKAFFDNIKYCGSCEYGCLGLDCKRPFGNSGVQQDMFEIIGIEADVKCPNCGDEYTQEQYEYVDDLYQNKLVPYLKELANKTLNLT